MRSFFAALTRHPLSLTGAAITTATAIVFAVFFMLELFGFHGHPYAGIIAYLIVPALFVAGLLLIPVGLRLSRQRAGLAQRLPVIDLNVDRTRNRVLIFIALTAINIVVVAVAAYKGVEVMDTTGFCGETCHSVMEPEHTAFQRGAHASARCIDCHIGPGASWFVKSKLSGSWQVVSVALDLYPTPIPTPVENLRPARETCEQCHWPQKFVGDRLKVLTKYRPNEENTELKTVLLLRVGGIEGRTSHGIHWHVDPANAIRYRSDESRETIHEVEMTEASGEVVHYYADGDEEASKAAGGVWRTMDCVDCHNRPSHTFHAPEQEIDSAMATGRIAKDLPFVRREGLKLLQAEYRDKAAAAEAIRTGLVGFYRDQFPEVAADRAADIEAAADELAEAWRSNVFPGMSITWNTYPNHIGHMQSPGCFRCHDDSHTSPGGRTIAQDCDTCHSLLAEEEVEPEILATLAP